MLLAGLEQARSRFGRCDPGTDEAFYAIFEALAWIGAIRDRLSLDGVDPPAIIDGLYYMRNVVLHQGADVLYWLLISSGKLGTASLGTMKFGGGSLPRKPQWPAVGQFTPPRPPRTGEKEYETMLAGKSVVATLNDATSSLRVWGLSGDSTEGVRS